MRQFTGLFLFTFFLLSVSCTKKKSPVPVPSDAVIITRVNSKEIITQIAKEKLTDFSWDDLFSTSEEDTTQQKKGWESILEDPSEAGIDLLEDVWAFYRNSEIGIIASIQDADELEEAIAQNITKNIIHSEKLSAFTAKKVSAVWNQEYVLFLISENPASEKYLFSLLSSERNLFNAPISEEDEEKEVLIWTSNQYLKNFIPSSFQELIHSDSFSITNINFDQGKTTISTRNLINNSSQVLQKIHVNPHFFNEDDLLKMAVSLNLNSTAINNPNFSQSFIQQCFDGNIYLNIDSIKSYETIYKTTKVDDEFNTIETTDTIKNYYPSFHLFASSNNNDSCKLFLKKLEDMGLLIEDKKKYKFSLTSYPVYFKIQNKGLEIYSSLFSESENFYSETTIDPLFYTKFNNKLKSLNFIPSTLQNITLLVIPELNDNLTIHSTIETSEKEEYSLLTLISIARSYSSSFIMEEPEVIQ